MNQPNNNKPQTLTHPAANLIRLLVGGYVAISFGAIVALIALHYHPAQASQEAWVHGIIVAAMSLLMTRFAMGTIQGKDRMLLRLRITSTIMIIAIAITSAIPGDFPVWMKIEQSVCGLLLIALAFVLSRKNTNV